MLAPRDEETIDEMVDRVELPPREPSRTSHPEYYIRTATARQSWATRCREVEEILDTI